LHDRSRTAPPAAAAAAATRRSPESVCMLGIDGVNVEPEKAGERSHVRSNAHARRRYARLCPSWRVLSTMNGQNIIRPFINDHITNN